jgi:uncharacterized protein (DUF2132 family)
MNCSQIQGNGLNDGIPLERLITPLVEFYNKNALINGIQA